MIKYIILILCMAFGWCAYRDSTTPNLYINSNKCETNSTNGVYNCSLISWTWLNNNINILGKSLEICSKDPITWYERDGYCKTWPQDPANHSICAIVNDEFLQYNLERGNDLITPNPRYNFAWLKSGDRWCLCASRRYQAYLDGVVSQIITWSTNIEATKVIPWPL